MKTQSDSSLYKFFKAYQEAHERLRDQYARGSHSYNLNDGKASAFQMLAGDAKDGELPFVWDPKAHDGLYINRDPVPSPSRHGKFQRFDTPCPG